MKKWIVLMGCVCCINASVDTLADGVTATVETVALKQRMMGRQVVGYGQVVTDVRQLYSVSMRHAGQIQELAVRTGQYVRQGDTLLTSVTAPEAQQAWRQAVLALQVARDERVRVAQLFKQQLATASQWAAADHAVNDAQAVVTAQQQLGQDHTQWIVRAPGAGWVQGVSVTPGDRVQAGTVLLQLNAVSGQRVSLMVDAQDVAQLRPGLTVQCASLVTSNKRGSGRIDQVSGVLNPQTQQAEVTVRMQGAIWIPGERVRGNIELPQRSLNVVPRSAVLSDESGDYIYQVLNHHAWRVSVHTGVESGDWLAVSGPVWLNAPVVAVGNYELHNGMAVHSAVNVKTAP